MLAPTQFQKYVEIDAESTTTVYIEDDLPATVVYHPKVTILNTGEETVSVSVTFVLDFGDTENDETTGEFETALLVAEEIEIGVGMELPLFGAMFISAHNAPTNPRRHKIDIVNATENPAVVRLLYTGILDVTRSPGNNFRSV